MKFSVVIDRFSCPFSLSIDGDWDDFGRIELVPVQPKNPAAAREDEAIRHWLRHRATGLFGHLIGSDTVARPSDIMAALRSQKDWTVTVKRANPRVVAPKLPEGAVT